MFGKLDQKISQSIQRDGVIDLIELKTSLGFFLSLMLIFFMLLNNFKKLFLIFSLSNFLICFHTLSLISYFFSLCTGSDSIIAQRIFSVLDENGDGVIEFTEFIKASFFLFFSNIFFILPLQNTHFLDISTFSLSLIYFLSNLFAILFVSLL